MSPSIRSLTIDGYRLFSHIQVDQIGDVNLVTGSNNAGKSTLLEALRIWASAGAPTVLQSILRYREEDQADPASTGVADEAAARHPCEQLFHTLPELALRVPQVTIAARCDGTDDPLTMEFVHAADEAPAGETPDGPALWVSKGSFKRLIPQAFRRRIAPALRPIGTELGDTPRSACVFLGPYAAQETNELGVLWDKIALSDQERDVVEALRIVEPTIRAVSMVGGFEGRRGRTAIVRTDRSRDPVPLRSYGDGVSRVFGIALSLVNAAGGLLLIDEFENGLHYSTQYAVWRAIFGLARRLQVQVFATSHSWDAVEAFQRAASESEADGALIKVSRRGEATYATTFVEDELAVVTRDRIEVR
jgi:hypothetical protein